MNIEDKMQSIK